MVGTFLLYSPSREDKVFEDVLLQDIPYRVVRSNSLLYIQQQTISEKFHCRATPKYWPAKPSQGKRDSMYLRHRKRAFFCQNCPFISLDERVVLVLTSRARYEVA
jgi:hypothetical protein